jgi:fucose permease
MVCSALIIEEMAKHFTECLLQSGQPVGEKGTSESSQFNQIFRLKEVHLLAFFILVYVGVEVTVGGQDTS